MSTAAALAAASSLADVLLRAHAYVVDYEDRLAGLVCEERYEQRLIDRAGALTGRRTLVSDYLVFQIPPEESWFAFRDTFEVDGEPVRDRQERFRDLLAGSDGAVQQAMKIAEESARYNLGDVYRTINLPTFALAFLRPANRNRFKFEKAGEETIEGVATWVVAYRELKQPTVIGLPGEGDLFTHGRFWIEPVTGRVVQSELVAGGDQPVSIRRWGRKSRRIRSTATIVVKYGPAPGLDIWVPARMDEVYADRKGRPGDTIEGTATYSNFRPAAVKGRLRPPS